MCFFVVQWVLYDLSLYFELGGKRQHSYSFFFFSFFSFLEVKTAGDKLHGQVLLYLANFTNYYTTVCQNHLSTDPVRLTSLCKRILSTTISKAALRSRSTRMDVQSELALSCRSFNTLSRPSY